MLNTLIVFPGVSSADTPFESEFRITPSELSTVHVPPQIGKIEEIFKGKSEKTVILIQDAHAIPDAQRNIEKIIEYFQEKYGIRLIGLEGANAQLDPQMFKSFPDKEILRKVLGEYYERGELSGGSAAAIFSNFSATFHGLEDWGLYEQGLGLYLASMKEAQQLKVKLEKWDKDLERRKKESYPRALLRVDKKLRAFQDNQADLVRVLKFLASIKSPDEGTEIAAVLEESAQEGKENLPVEMEVKQIAGQVEKYLRSLGPNREVQDQLKRFHAKQQEFQTSQMSPQAFALFLKEFAEAEGLLIEISGELSGGVTHHRMMRDINGTKFFEGYEAYARAVKDSLFENDQQRKIDLENSLSVLMGRLIELELSREDWRRFEESRGIMRGQTFISENDIKLHKAFYQNALQRDQVLLDRLLTMMEQKNSKVGLNAGLLVAGGFHAEGLTQLLKNANISFILVMPKIGVVPSETHYQEQMNGDVSWKHYLKAQDGKINPYQAFIRGSRDQLLKLSKEQGALKKAWRDQLIRDLAEKKEIKKAGEYTKFIDETVEIQPNAGAEQTELDRGLEKINRFIDGLRHLKDQNDLTEQNVLNLLKPATIAQGIIGPELDPTVVERTPENLAASVIGQISQPAAARAEVRSETRAMPDQEIDEFLRITANINEATSFEELRDAYSRLQTLQKSGAISEEQRKQIEYQRFINREDSAKARVRVARGELDQSYNYYGGVEMEQWYKAMQLVESADVSIEELLGLFKMLHTTAYQGTPFIYYEVRKAEDAYRKGKISEAEMREIIEGVLKYDEIKNRFKGGRINQTERDERMRAPEIQKALYRLSALEGHPSHEYLLGKLRTDLLDEGTFAQELLYDVTELEIPGQSEAEKASRDAVFTLEELVRLTGNADFGKDGNYKNRNPYLMIERVKPYGGKIKPRYKEAGTGDYEGQAFEVRMFFTQSRDVRGQVFNCLKVFQQRWDISITLKEKVESVLNLQKELLMIHPMVDGNGRTTRLLVDYLLSRIGLPPPLIPYETEMESPLSEMTEATFKAMQAYLLAYRSVFLDQRGGEKVHDTLPKPRGKAPVEKDPMEARREGTAKGHQQFPSNPTVTSIVVANQNGKIVFTMRDGKLALPERYVLGGESAFDAAKEALSDPEMGAGFSQGDVEERVHFKEDLGFESKPNRAQAVYRYSLVAFADVDEGAMPGQMQVLAPDEIDLENVLPEHREIVRKIIEGEDLFERTGAESFVNVRDYQNRIAAERPADAKKAERTQAVHAEIMARGHVQPVVASDTIVEYYDQDGNFQGIVLIERARDGHLATPGGFARQSEPAEYNAARETFEETGLADVKLERLIRVATRPDRDERSFIISPVFLGRVQGRRPTPGSDAKGMRFFKTRQELEDYILNPDHWVRAGRAEDALNADEIEILDAVRSQRAKDGKISDANILRLQKMMEARRRAKKFGVLWADHLEHLLAYFNYKDAVREKVERSTAAINLEPTRIVVDLESVIQMKAGAEPVLDYQMLVSLKELIDQGTQVIVVGPQNQKALFERLFSEMSKFESLNESSRESLQEIFIFYDDVAYSSKKFDAKTLSLSSRPNHTGTQGAQIVLERKNVDRKLDFDLTSFLGFLKWLYYSRHFNMGNLDEGRPFDYEKAMILLNMGVSLQFYQDYAQYDAETLRQILSERWSKMREFVRSQKLSDLHTHPTGAGRASFVLEIAYQDLMGEKKIDWKWVNREFQRNIDDLGYSSFEEMVLARDLAAIHYLIATPHKADDKSLVEYFQRYGIIQNVNLNEQTVVRIAREIAEDSAREGVRYLELRFAVTTRKNEEWAQKAYLPPRIDGLNDEQLNDLQNLPPSSAFKQAYEFDDVRKIFTLKLGIDERDAQLRAAIANILDRLNLIGMQTLINIMANYRGMKMAREDYPDFRFKMIVIIPKTDSPEVSALTINDVTLLKKIARALKKAKIKTAGRRNIEDAIRTVIQDDEESVRFYTEQILRQSQKDSMEDMIEALDSIIGMDTAGPEFLFYKDYPKALSDFIVEFDAMLSEEDKDFLRSKAYRGNWIAADLEKKFNGYKGKSIDELIAIQNANPELGLQDLIRLRQILVKVNYSGRVRFIARKLQGIFDTAIATKFEDSRLYTESTSHAGEAYASLEDGLLAVREAVEFLGANRIGHGVAVGTDPEELLGTVDGYGRIYDVERVNRLIRMQEELMRYLIQKGIAIEINVSSNLQTGNVPDVFKHPFFRLFRAGVPLVVGTDGLTVSNTTLADEVTEAAMAFNLSEDSTRVLIDKIVSRIGIVSMNEILNNPGYRSVLNKMPPELRTTAVNNIKTLLTLTAEADRMTESGRQLAAWLKSVDVPLDIFALSVFVIERGVRPTSEWIALISSHPAWDGTLFDRAMDLAKRIAARDAGALEELIELRDQNQKKLVDMILLIILAQFIDVSSFNQLTGQIEIFQRLKSQMMSLPSRSEIRNFFGSLEFIALERAFGKAGQISVSAQPRAPPKPVPIQRKAEVIFDFSTTQVTQDDLSAFLASWRMSPSLFRFKVISGSQGQDLIIDLLLKEGFIKTRDEVEVIEKAPPKIDILITDDRQKSFLSSRSLLISRDSQTQKTRYSFGAQEVSGDLIAAQINRAAYSSTGRMKSADELDSILEGRKVLALTGFTMQKFDKTKARLFLETLLETLNPMTTALVMGTNEDGLDQLILEAVETYYQKYGQKFLVIGAMPGEGFQWKPGNVDYLIPFGMTWPDDTPVFLRKAGAVFRLGGGPFARDREYRASELGIPTFVPSGYGGVSSHYGVESEIQRAELAAAIHHELFRENTLTTDEFLGSQFAAEQYDRVIVGKIDDLQQMREELAQKAAQAAGQGRKLAVLFDASDRPVADTLQALALENLSITPIGLAGQNAFYNALAETEAMIFDDEIKIGKLMVQLRSNTELGIETVGSFEGLAERDYPLSKEKVVAATPMPTLVGLATYEVPDADEQKRVLADLEGKMVFRLIGGSADMEDWLPERREFYYGRLSRFFDDLFGVYGDPAKIVIMLDMEPDLFQQIVIQVALERGVKVVGVMHTFNAQGKGQGLNLGEMKATRNGASIDPAQEVLIVRQTEDLWDLADAFLVMGGQVSDMRQHTELLTARLTDSRRRKVVMVDGFGNEGAALTDQYGKENRQPQIQDARSLMVYLQPRLRTVILSAKDMKGVNKLKLEPSNKYELPLVFQRSHRAIEGFNPAELITNLKGADPELARLYDSPNTGWEGGTVEDHTRVVASNVENQLAQLADRDGVINWLAVLRMAVALHDIGKPINHARQHEETKKIIMRKFDEWGMTSQQKAFATALIDGDPVGIMADPTSSRTPAESMDELRRMAEKSQIDPALFYTLLVTFYIADASSYDGTKIIGFSQLENGRLVINRDEKKTMALLDLIEKETDGRFKADDFRTSLPVHDPKILPAVLRDFRYAETGKGGMRSEMPWAAGREFVSAVRAVHALKKLGYTKVIPLDSTDMTESQIAAELEARLSQAALEPDAAKHTVVIILAKDVSALTQARELAAKFNFKTMAFLSRSLFNPEMNLRIPRNDFWMIDNDDNGPRLKQAFSEMVEGLSAQSLQDAQRSEMRNLSLTFSAIVGAVVEGASINRSEVRHAIEFVNVEGIVAFQTSLVDVLRERVGERQAEGQKEQNIASIWDSEIAALIASLDPYKSAGAQDLKFAIGLALPASTEESLIRNLMKVLGSDEASQVDTVVVIGKINETLQQELQKKSKHLRPLKDLTRGVTLIGQDSLPIGVFGELQETIHQMFMPFEIEGWEKIDDPLVKDYIEVLQVVALIHAAALLTEKPTLLKEEFQAELIGRLKQFANPEWSQLFSPSEQGFRISAVIAQKFLEVKAAQAAARAA